MKKRGICVNIGSCKKADSNEIVVVTGHNFVCDSCGSDLSPIRRVGVVSPRFVVLSVVILVSLMIVGLQILPWDTERPLVTEKPLVTDELVVAERPHVTKEPTVAEEFVVIKPGTTSQQRPNVVAAAKKVSEGQRLMARRRHRDARDAFARATELDDKNAFAWANLGAVEMILGEPRAAKRAYDAALRADRDNWLALYNLGVYFVRTGDTRQAFQRLDESLRVLEAQGSHEELRAALNDLKTNSTFSGVRHDPQFRSLLAR